MSNFESALNSLSGLVETFENGKDKYLTQEYSEAQARKDFIDKFFIALGWDVNHDEQKNPYKQEVRIELNINIQGRFKRADYAFYITPNFRDPVFYVEAKKPSLSIYNREDYFQIIKYGWNSKIPVVLLTDFKELHIIDSRYKPSLDNCLSAKIKSYSYHDYLTEDKFREIYHLFSREAVEALSINDFINSLPSAKKAVQQKTLFAGGYKSIDEHFLDELDEFRYALAKTLLQHTNIKDNYTLTEIVQRILDRLVFIRFLEDKQIEPDFIISTFGEKSTSWNDFINNSSALDRKYNGIVFKHHPSIDSLDLIPGDDKYFNDLCNEISHENSVYDFNKIPIHILGSIYERFLGSIIEIKKNSFKIEEKPLVRKSGGVFYTPQYIVDYIVRNTVYKLIDGKSPKEIESLKIADISCGSGSFLITVLDTLFYYHNIWYQDHPNQAKRAGCKFMDGRWVLSLYQKQKILLNNVYGIDIDYQAVEVTQLSLYLKLLEDETMATAEDLMVLIGEKILPDLSNNIICANSVVDEDFNIKDLFDTSDISHLNIFNIKNIFKSIFAQGGFDIILGNPPYVRIHLLEENLAEYFIEKYSLSGQVDLYSAFIKRSIDFLKQGGSLGYIVPRFLQFNLDSKPIRDLLLSYEIQNLTEVGQAFDEVSTECMVFTVKKNTKIKNEIEIFDYYPNERLNKVKKIDQSFFKKLPAHIFNSIISDDDFRLIKKIQKYSEDLGSITTIKRGMEIGKKKVKSYNSGFKTLIGEDVSAFSIRFGETYCPKSHKEIRRFNEFLNTKKGLLRRVSNRLTAVYTAEDFYFTKNLYGILCDKYDIEYIVGLLNSNLFSYYFKKYFTTKKEEIFPEFQSYQINELPIKIIKNEKGKTYEFYSDIIKLVVDITALNSKMLTVKNERGLLITNRKITQCINSLNSIIYSLYDLTNNEIELIEAFFNDN